MRKLLTKYYENKIKKEYIKQEELFDEISKTVIAINLAKDKCNTCNLNYCNNICIINDNIVDNLLLKKEKLKQKLKKSSYKIAIYNLKQSSL